MVKMLSVMLALCSIYTSSPDTSNPAWIQSAVEGIILQEEVSSGVLPEEIIREEQGEPPVITDYLAELEKLNYLRNETKDDNLNKRNAIIRFQSDHNLTVTGEWNDDLEKILQERLKDENYMHPDEVTEAPTENKWITINKTKKTLTLYMGKTVLKKYPVALGNPPSLTPSGKFKIANRVKNPAWGGGGYAEPVSGGSPQNPLGYRWMGLSHMGGSRYGIHGNNMPYSIGRYVSHGCIRMINSDVEELFDMASISMLVWIGTDNELKEWGVNQKPYGDQE